MLSLRKSSKPPIDYSKCNQTVTVYRQQESEYKRIVCNNAFFDFKKTLNVDKIGSSQTNSFILVIPGDVQSVFVGDKVYLGEGPEIKTREEWSAFIPVKVSGLVVVKCADVKYFDNRVVHTEAGG